MKNEKSIHVLTSKFLSSRGKDDYGKLFTRLYPTCLIYATNIIKNDIDSEDIVVDSFLICYNKIDSYKTQYSFSSWLFKIIKNKCIAYIKKSKFLYNLHDCMDIEHLHLSNRVLFSDDVIYESKTLDDNINNQDMKLYIILRELKKIKYGDVFIDYHINKYTLDELCDKYNLNKNVILVRLTRVKEELKTNIQKNNLFLKICSDNLL
jgi:RNA polymerase sigma factor (sigma-70 family)